MILEQSGKKNCIISSGAAIISTKNNKYYKTIKQDLRDFLIGTNKNLSITARLIVKDVLLI